MVSPCTPGGEARLLLKNRFHAGDALELLTPDGPRPITAEPLGPGKTGEVMDTLGVRGKHRNAACPSPAAEGDLLRGPVRNHRV